MQPAGAVTLMPAPSDDSKRLSEPPAQLARQPSVPASTQAQSRPRVRLMAALGAVLVMLAVVSVFALQGQSGNGAPAQSPTAASTRPPFTPAQPGMHLYTVQPGDTLADIAARFSVSVDLLSAANGIDRDAALTVGQQLWIPPVEAAYTPSPTPTVTITPSPTVTATPTSTPTATPSPTNTFRPRPSATATRVPPTATQSASPTKPPVQPTQKPANTSAPPATAMKTPKPPEKFSPTPKSLLDRQTHQDRCVRELTCSNG